MSSSGWLILAMARVGPAWDVEVTPERGREKLLDVARGERAEVHVGERSQAA